MLTDLTGRRALLRMAYGTVIIAGYQYHSTLYVNRLDFTPTEPLFTASTDDGQVLHPLSMEPSGVGFTYAYFGAPWVPWACIVWTMPVRFWRPCLGTGGLWALTGPWAG